MRNLKNYGILNRTKSRKFKKGDRVTIVRIGARDAFFGSSLGKTFIGQSGMIMNDPSWYPLTKYHSLDIQMDDSKKSIGFYQVKIEKES